jgi:outer membrane protein assembly factor BamB
MSNEYDPAVIASKKAGETHLMAKLPDSMILAGSKDDPIADILLVSTIDGQIHAIDKNSGFILWSNGELGGSLLIGSSKSAYSDGDEATWTLSQEPIFILEPVFPGNIYVYVPGDLIQVFSSHFP